MISPEIFFFDLDRFMDELGFPHRLIYVFENSIPLCFYKFDIQSIFILMLPSIDEYMVMQSISHEYTHHIICELEGYETSKMYDNIANIVEIVAGIITKEIQNNPNIELRG